MCIFCMIANGEIPSKKLYEDDKVLAFLDLSQTTNGHTLVVPKQHFETLIDVDPETLAHMIKVTQQLTKDIMKKTGATGFNLLNNGYEVAGQTVMHAHIHIIPRYSKEDAIVIDFKENPNKDIDKTYELLK
ncbi:MAG: HIT family protein [Erysipelotrichaceae bacterium]|nr:HIT family protein [Erysipelotrichaceae bacterium]